MTQKGRSESPQYCTTMKKHRAQYMNPTRLLPSRRRNNIHFYKKHRRVDPIHFTMSSSTKTTQPRDPAKSSHFRRKMAHPKETNQSKPVRPAQANLTHWAHDSSKTSKTFRPWQSIDRKNRKLEVQNCARPQTWHSGAKICHWQAQQRPWASQMEPQTFIRGLLNFQNFTWAGPARPPTNLSKWSSKILPVAGPVKPTGVTIKERKICHWHQMESTISSAAAKTISLTIWSWQAQQRSS